MQGYLEVRAMTDAVDSTTGAVTPQDVWTKVLDQTAPTTANTKWNPYVLSDWVQNAAFIISAEGEMAGSAIRQDNITYDHNQEISMATVRYMIRNDAGIELPSTGGPGTDLLYLLGILMTGFAGAGLMLQRRRQQAA